MCGSRFPKSLSIWQWRLDKEGVIVVTETGSSVSGKRSRNQAKQKRSSVVT